MSISRTRTSGQQGEPSNGRSGTHPPKKSVYHLMYALIKMHHNLWDTDEKYSNVANQTVLAQTNARSRWVPS